MKKLVAMLTLSFVLAIVSSVSADIILSHTAVIDAMGMGGTEMVVTQKIKGEMDHTLVTSTGKGMMAGAAQTAENIIISRMDKGVMWVLSPATKTYIEYPLATMKAMADAGEAQAESDSTADQEYNWTITIDTLAESTINGFACKGIKGVAEGVSLNPPGDRTRMTYEVWVGKDLPGNDELTKHYQRMSELTGQNAYSQGEMVSQILGKGEKQLRQLAEAAEKLDGYPVRMEVTVATTVDLGKEMEGEAGDDSEATAMMEQVKALMKGQVGEDGLTTVVSLRSNMTKIEVVPVDASVFDIPEGFTRGF